MLEIQLPHGSPIPVLRIHTEVKAGTRTDICTPTFIAALLTTAERWEQLKSPPAMNGQIRRGLYTEWNSTESFKARNPDTCYSTAETWRTPCQVK